MKNNANFFNHRDTEKLSVHVCFDFKWSPQRKLRFKRIYRREHALCSPFNVSCSANNLLGNFSVFSVFLWLIFVLFVSGCSDIPQGFSKTPSGLVFRFLELGDGNVAKADNYVRFAYEVKDEEDSMLYSSRMVVHLLKDAKNGFLEEGLLMMREGDKADFMLEPNEFYKTYMQETMPSHLSEQSLKVQVKVLDIQTDLEYEKNKNFFYQKLAQSRMDTSAHTELTRIADYITKNNLKVITTASGLSYFFINDVENDKKVSYGKLLYLNYKGKFFDGRTFNSTYVKETPQDMIYGQELQVIAGIEEALVLMNEGDKIALILPSSLAFGSKGSSNGTVPPNTPVYYEVELLKVN